MFTRNIKIFSSELLLCALSCQILFGSVMGVSAINPELIGSIQTHSAVDGYAFDMDGTTYLAIGNTLSGHPATIVQPQLDGTLIPFQDLPDSASDFEYFTISGESYLAVANIYTDDEIYKYDGGSFTGFQVLPASIDATAFEHMTISGSEYLAVANGGGTDYSKVLEWTGTGFVEQYDIGDISSISDIETYELKSWKGYDYYPYAQLLADNGIIDAQATESGYLLDNQHTRAQYAKIVALIGGHTPTQCNGGVYADIDASVPECGYIEALNNAGVIDSTIDYNPYAYITKIDAIEMGLRSIGEPSSQNSSYYQDVDELSASQVGYATRARELSCSGDDTALHPYYPLSRGEIYQFLSCITGLDQSGTYPIGTLSGSSMYMALSDGKIYSMTASGTSLMQTVYSNGPADIQFVTDNQDQYLLYLDHGSSRLSVYRWNGSQFDLDDDTIRLSTSGGARLGLDVFQSKGKTYIITTNGGNDSSTIYRFDNTRLTEYQYINDVQSGSNIEIHESWTQFKLGSKQMLFLANVFNTTDSYMFEWNEVPHVVISSPISGESYAPTIWDPAVTPITGHGNPKMQLAIYDANDIAIGSGTTDAIGDFSIMTTANTGTVLPIRVVPYSGATLGDAKYINYLDIRPTPLPTSSRPSGAFDAPFTLIISGEAPYYSTGNTIEYAVYEDGLFTVSGEFHDSYNISIPAKSTRVEYKGVNASGISTATQIREFYYDTTAPVIAHEVYATLSPVISNNHIVTDLKPDITAIVQDPTLTRIRITNNSPDTDVKISHINTYIKISSGTTYTGTTCLRTVGSTNPCGSYDTSTGVAMKTLSNRIDFSIPGDDPSIPYGTYKDYEIYNQSPYVFGLTDIIETDVVSLVYEVPYSSDVTSLYESTGSVLLYVGGGGPVSSTMSPTFTSTSIDTYYMTGSLAQVLLQAYDTGINFESDVATYFPGFGDILTNTGVGYIYIGQYGITKNVTGYKDVIIGDNLIKYSAMDNVGNTTSRGFVINRVPYVDEPIIGYSGDVVYASFNSDALVSGEYTYSIHGQTHTGTMDIQSGQNNLILTGVTLSGSVSLSIGVEQYLPAMTLPYDVYNAVKQSTVHNFDAIPDAITIPSRTSVGFGQVVEFGPYTLSGFNVPLTAMASTGTLSVNNGPATSQAVTVNAGDTLKIVMTAPTAYSTTRAGVLTVGSVAIPYSLETLMAPPKINLVLVGAGGGGGGGAGSSSAGTTSAATAGVTSISGSPFNNTALLLSNWNIGAKNPTVARPRGPDTQVLTYITEVASIYIGDIQKAISSTKNVTEKVEVIDKSIQTYGERMAQSKILSQEYILYRKIKKDLRQMKRSIAQ